MSFHEEHCDQCFSTLCSSTDCSIIKCKFCHFSLHTCKMTDHLAEICGKVKVPCPNRVNGCDLDIQRDQISSHLANCVASVVVCHHNRCRKLNAKTCKMELKRMGRRNEQLPVDHDDLDVSLALYDQNLIIESYNSSRTTRVRQRDPCHPNHPLIPLRNMPFNENLPTQGSEDSSEEELEAIRARVRQMRMVFANCGMCQIDPSVQHLHTLGNGTDIERMKKWRVTAKKNEVFHERLNLKVSTAVENVSESIMKRGQDPRKGDIYYTLMCLKTICRSEYADHCLSQHVQSVNQLNEMIVRCPNWASGCMFSTSRIKPVTGELKFHAHSATITHDVCPSPRFMISKTSDLTLETIEPFAYKLFDSYLPSSSLYNLSLTCKRLRELVFVGSKLRCYVESAWEKPRENGGWVQKPFVRKINATEPPPKLEWSVPVELTKHLQTCFHNRPKLDERERVPIFPLNLRRDIWLGFETAMFQRFDRAYIAQIILQDQEDQARQNAAQAGPP